MTHVLDLAVIEQAEKLLNRKFSRQYQAAEVYDLTVQFSYWDTKYANLIIIEYDMEAGTVSVQVEDETTFKEITVPLGSLSLIPAK